MSPSARDLIHALPSRLKAEKAKAGGHAARVHFIFSGVGGCELTVVMADGQCHVTDGLEGTPDCVVRAKAKDYADLELGKIDPKMAFLFGKIKVSRPAMMMTFIGLFRGALE
jgi:acyl-CoA dehydrogenase